MNIKSWALVAGLGCTVLAAAQAGPLDPLVGKKVPPFTMKDTAGHKVTDKSLRGKVVLLDFWATWCGPCKLASPAMQELHKKYAKQGLVVIGANTGDGGSVTAAPTYAKQHHYTYMFTTANDGYATKLNITGIPAFVIVDRKGVVRRVQMGYAPVLAYQFEDVVKQLLKEKA